MRRWGNIAVLISAVVCVLSAALVVRSVWVADFLRVRIVQNSNLVIGSFDAQCSVLVFDVMDDGFVYKRDATPVIRATLAATWPQMRGVRWLGIGWGNFQGIKIVIVPLWLVPILTAILPVRWWRRRGRERGRGFAVEMSRGLRSSAF